MNVFLPSDAMEVKTIVLKTLSKSETKECQDDPMQFISSSCAPVSSFVKWGYELEQNKNPFLHNGQFRKEIHESATPSLIQSEMALSWILT